MLSYQHVFHAGNHADILKHTVLVHVLEYMNQKDKPYTYFDTHAGSGLYRLDDERALKTGENEAGIKRLFQNKEMVSEFIPSYLKIAEKWNKKGIYPGSSFIALEVLRKTDFSVFSDLHPSVFDELSENVKFFQNENPECSRVSLHKRNGFEMLKSLTPPVTKRGVVLIDPSYEDKTDYEETALCVIDRFKKWSGGVYLIWYPLLTYRMGLIESMLDQIENGVRSVFPNTEIRDFRLKVAEEDEHIETELSDTQTPRLYGSGMFVINSPWKLDEKMDEVIPVLEKILKR